MRSTVEGLRSVAIRRLRCDHAPGVLVPPMQRSVSQPRAALWQLWASQRVEAGAQQQAWHSSAPDALPARRWSPKAALSAHYSFNVSDLFVIAGVSFEGRQEYVCRLEQREPVLLQREPWNPYDPQAVAVVSMMGEKLGYVPRVKNPVYGLWDQGTGLVASCGANHMGLWGATVHARPWLPGLLADVLPPALPAQLPALQRWVAEQLQEEVWRQHAQRVRERAGRACEVARLSEDAVQEQQQQDGGPWRTDASVASSSSGTPAGAGDGGWLAGPDGCGFVTLPVWRCDPQQRVAQLVDLMHVCPQVASSKALLHHVVHGSSSSISGGDAAEEQQLQQGLELVKSINGMNESDLLLYVAVQQRRARAMREADSSGIGWTVRVDAAALEEEQQRRAAVQQQQQLLRANRKYA